LTFHIAVLTLYPKAVPAVAAGRPPLKPWILTAARFDNLLNVYRVLHPLKIFPWINQHPKFIVFLMLQNLDLHGDWSGGEPHIARFFCRNVYPGETAYLITRVTREVAAPDSTGNANCSDVFPALDDAHTYMQLELGLDCNVRIPSFFRACTEGQKLRSMPSTPF
jgi:hypothetical protein